MNHAQRQKAGDRAKDNLISDLAASYTQRRPDAEAVSAADDLARRRQLLHTDRQRREQERAKQRKADMRDAHTLKHARHLASQQERKHLRSARRLQRGVNAAGSLPTPPNADRR